MKITIGRKGKKNNVYAIRVKVLDQHSTPRRSMQFSLADAESIESAFDVVLTGTRKEIESQSKMKHEKEEKKT